MKSRLALVLAADALLAAAVLAGLLVQADGRDAAAPLVTVARIPAMDDLSFMNARGQVRVTGRPGGRWSLHLGGRSFPAAGQKVEAFLRSLDGAAVTRTVTANPALWPQFEVEESAKIRLAFNAPGGRLELILGKPGPGDSDLYLRVAGRNEVFLVEGGLVFYAEQGLEYWLELRLFERAFDGPDVVRIDLSDRAGAWAVLRGRDERGAPVWLWQGAGERRLKQRATDAWAADLAGATAASFALDERAAAAGQDSGTASIVVTTVKGEEYRLRLGGRSGDREWLVSRSMQGGEALGYLIDEAWRVRLLKSPADLTE